MTGYGGDQARRDGPGPQERRAVWTGSSARSLASSDVLAVLARAGEAEAELAARLAMWRDGFAAGHHAGYAAGRADEGAERERAWRRSAGMIVARLDPGSAEARASAERRVRAAEAGCRRDAAAWWVTYHRREAAR